MASESENLYWRRKLHAYLHDSPNKVLDILDHEHSARRIAAGDQFSVDERFRNEADWAASAADRLPWPTRVRTDTIQFRHPLDGSLLPLGDISSQLAEEIAQTNKPKLEDEHPFRAFLATWRFWRNWASSAHASFAHYPGETRLPDHTIWSHLAVTSALQGCFGGEPWSKDKPALPADRPCFLLFAIGPVQDFIAAARSTRDLWSGSYLLSYLIASALHKITMDFGPDHVLFPNLCGQPILDLMLKDEWEEMSTKRGDLWQAFDYYREEGKRRLLTPSLPNRFLACTAWWHGGTSELWKQFRQRGVLRAQLGRSHADTAWRDRRVRKGGARQAYLRFRFGALQLPSQTPFWKSTGRFSLGPMTLSLRENRPHYFRTMFRKPATRHAPDRKRSPISWRIPRWRTGTGATSTTVRQAGSSKPLLHGARSTF